MPKYHGKKGVIYLSTSGAGVAVAIVQLSAWSLDMQTDKVEVTSFGDANKTFVQGLKDLKGQLSGFWNSADDSLFQAADSADGCKAYLYPSSDAPTKYWYGPAWLDASIDTPVSGPVAVKANIVANGSWGRL